MRLKHGQNISYKGHKVIPKIVDNNRRVFVDLIKQIAPKHDELSIATGYWDLSGTKLIIDELKNFKKIRDRKSVV